MRTRFVTSPTLERVRAVVLDGQLLNQGAIRRLLDDVAERARQPSPTTGVSWPE